MDVPARQRKFRDSASARDPPPGLGDSPSAPARPTARACAGAGGSAAIDEGGTHRSSNLRRSSYFAPFSGPPERTPRRRASLPRGRGHLHRLRGRSGRRRRAAATRPGEGRRGAGVHRVGRLGAVLVVRPVPRVVHHDPGPGSTARRYLYRPSIFTDNELPLLAGPGDLGVRQEARGHGAQHGRLRRHPARRADALPTWSARAADQRHDDGHRVRGARRSGRARGPARPLHAGSSRTPRPASRPRSRSSCASTLTSPLHTSADGTPKLFHRAARR